MPSQVLALEDGSLDVAEDQLATLRPDASRSLVWSLCVQIAVLLRIGLSNPIILIQSDFLIRSLSL